MRNSDQRLHYELQGGMLVRRAGLLNWRCPDCLCSGTSLEVMKVCPKCQNKYKAKRSTRTGEPICRKCGNGYGSEFDNLCTQCRGCSVDRARRQRQAG